jgi:nitrogen fixation protein FixH
MTALTWFRTGDRWIPSLFVGAFLVILAVNGTMIWIALSTFGGLATADYYDRGRTYNATLAAAVDIEQLGWQVGIAARPLGGGQYAIEVSLLQADGVAVNGASVLARFVRPANEADDFEVTLTSEGQGIWSQVITPPADGLWEVRLLAERDGQVSATGHRLVLQP